MINLVWLKRDFRLNDHAPLFFSQQNTRPTLFLYVIEPEYWSLADTSKRQFQFIAQSIHSFANELARYNGFICIRSGSVVDILEKIHQKYPIHSLYCHQETGNDWTYKRDTQVFKWCKAQHISSFEYQQQAVFRTKLNRDHWQAKASKWLDSSTYRIPNRINSLLTQHSGLSLLNIYPGNDKFSALESQQGGLYQANKTLESFFGGRINQYMYGISSPIKSITASSRLSPYLCYGVLSLREVIHRAYALKVDKKNLSGFIARLHWHSHFVQKLESEPRYAYESVHKSLINMRASEFNAQSFIRWQHGQTGVPFVDACMRMLLKTGWINFRMRAMLMSFASYHLWLDWPKTGAFLASTFVDYEPGIHYPQVQMQSGTTGINPFRIYNPVTQGEKYDPKGGFIRHYIPELAHVPDSYIHRPWLYAGLKTDLYDKPSQLPEEAASTAKSKIKSFYDRHLDKNETQRVITTHASRKRQPNRTKSASNNQLSLF